MRCRSAFLFVSSSDRASANFEFIDVVFEYAGRNWNNSSHVISAGAGPGLNVRNMRCSTSLRAQTKKANINATQRFQLFQISFQFSFHVVRVRLHRRKAFYLFEKGASQQSFEIAHKAQPVIHAQWRQRVLGENVKAFSRWSISSVRDISPSIRYNACAPRPPRRMMTRSPSLFPAARWISSNCTRPVRFSKTVAEKFAAIRISVVAI